MDQITIKGQVVTKGIPATFAGQSGIEQHGWYWKGEDGKQWGNTCYTEEEMLELKKKHEIDGRFRYC